MTLWKSVEREHARRLGTKRVGPQGKNTVDSLNIWLAVESKERKKLPKWLKDAMTQVYDNQPKDGIARLLVMVLHEKGGWYDEDILCMRLADFQEWFGDCNPYEEEPDTVDIGVGSLPIKESDLSPLNRRGEFTDANWAKVTQEQIDEFHGLEQYSKFKEKEDDTDDE